MISYNTYSICDPNWRDWMERLDRYTSPKEEPETAWVSIGCNGWLEEYVKPNPEIKKVIYNNPAVIVIWEDGTKTISKCDSQDDYSKETGLLWCIAKKCLGNTQIHKLMEKHLYKTDEYEVKTND